MSLSCFHAAATAAGAAIAAAAASATGGSRPAQNTQSSGSLQALPVVRPSASRPPAPPRGTHARTWRALPGVRLAAFARPRARVSALARRNAQLARKLSTLQAEIAAVVARLRAAATAHASRLSREQQHEQQQEQQQQQQQQSGGGHTRLPVVQVEEKGMLPSRQRVQKQLPLSIIQGAHCLQQQLAQAHMIAQTLKGSAPLREDHAIGCPPLITVTHAL